MSVEDNVQRVRDALIARMGVKSYLLPAGLIDALAKDTGESAITVRQCLGRLAKEHWIDGISHDGAPFRQVKIVGAVPAKPIDPGQQRWQAVLGRVAGVSQDDAVALAPLWRKLIEFDAAELDNVVSGLMNLRANLAAEIGRHRFLVSAKYLIGSSKLLDELASPALRAFGIDVGQFPSHPFYVVVAGCQSPKSVILVENPAALEAAVSTQAVNQCAFIATFGFGLGRQKEDYGNQLAVIVEDNFANAVTLTREGSSCPSAKELLAHRSITFWGDLDVAGIQIFLQLKRSIPALQLSALYQPMIDAIANPRTRHPYVDAVGNKDGQLKMAPQSADADTNFLLAVCQRFAVDQEIVTAEQITALAEQVLTVTDGRSV